MVVFVVFVATHGVIYEGDTLLGTYSTIQKAKDACDKAELTLDYANFWKVVPLWLDDEPTPEDRLSMLVNKVADLPEVVCRNSGDSW
jgi:hypothetical protein